jgi:hypothetical protein
MGIHLSIKLAVISTYFCIPLARTPCILETNKISNFEAHGGFLFTQLITAVYPTAYKAFWSEYARGL